MPSLYIVLERKIPNTDVYVNGSFLSKKSQELEELAKHLGVTTLMGFFSISAEELGSLLSEQDLETAPSTSKLGGEWFTAEEGLRTVHALLKSSAESSMGDQDHIAAELQEFARVLELARANSIRWHLAVDY
ncbi:MAG TPA: hypothetical protein VJX70_13790 [Candidatus Acidoferrum sp.]|nr:hypothetical protein [Candidatus Acidoferrum sp.]